MLNIIVRYALITTICSGLLSVAYLIWHEDRLVKKVRDGKSALDQPWFLDSLDGYSTKHLRVAMFKEYNQATVPSQTLVIVADSYLKRHPLDGKVWLWSSVFNHRAGNSEAADKNLSRAHQLSLNHRSNLERVFNRYIEIGRYDEAMEVARGLSFRDPLAFRRLFYLMGRLDDNYDALVEKMIPHSVPPQRRGLRSLNKDFYYSAAMNDAIRVKNLDLAKAIWRNVPSDLKANSKFGQSYIEFLVNSQDSQGIIDVWSEQSKGQITSGNLNHQSFLEVNSPCWNLIPLEGDEVIYDVFSSDQGQELRLEFSGNQNINFYHVRCSLLLEPSTEYVLSGEWKSEGITTLSGPFIDIYAPSIEGFYKKTESLTGFMPWKQFELRFYSHENAKAYFLRIRRSKSSYLDNRISGSFHVRGLKIRKVSSGAQLRPQPPLFSQ